MQNGEDLQRDEQKKEIGITIAVKATPNKYR
jgi:hypothetical protein